MILRFLRLFSAFRVLEQDRDATVQRLSQSVEEMTAQNLRLQDRIEFSEQDRARLWDSMQAAQAAKDLAYQMHLNVQWQKQGYAAPYPDAPQIPERHVPQAVTRATVGRPRLGSEMVRGVTEQFIQDLMTENKS